MTLLSIKSGKMQKEDDENYVICIFMCLLIPAGFDASKNT